MGDYSGTVYWKSIVGRVQERYTGPVVRPYWDSILGEYTGTVYWDSILGEYSGRVYWKSVLVQYTGTVYWTSTGTVLGHNSGRLLEEEYTGTV